MCETCCVNGRHAKNMLNINSGRRRNTMGKDTKGKGKTRAKKVKGGKRAAEKQDVTKLRFEAIAYVFVSRLANVL